MIIAIRPERLGVGRDEPTAETAQATGWTRIPGRVTQGTYLGDATEYRVLTDAVGELVIRGRTGRWTRRAGRSVREKR